MAQQQLINGVSYTQYTPAWEAAMNAENTKQAGVAGTAAGTAAGSAQNAEYTAAHPGYQVPPPPPSIAGLFSAVNGYGTGAPTAPAGNWQTQSLPGGSASMTGLSTAAGSAPTVPTVPTVAPGLSAAQSLQFARAKDQIGAGISGSVAGLRSELGASGMLGSGAQSRGTAAIINAGQGQLANESTSEATTAADQENTNNLANASAGVTQRGQTITAADAAAQNATAQRGQDLSLLEQQNTITANANAAAVANRNAILAGLIKSATAGGSY